MTGEATLSGRRLFGEEQFCKQGKVEAEYFMEAGTSTIDCQTF